MTTIESTKNERLINLYTKIRDIQIQIKGEVKMDSINRFALDESSSDAIKNFQNILEVCKKYYTSILSVFLYAQKNEDKCLITSDIKYNLSDSEHKLDFNIEKSLDIVKKGSSDQIDQIRMDAFTFSIIPSLFNFFLTDESVKNFHDYLFHFYDASNMELFYNIARVAFFSPQFIKFCKYVLAPLVTLDEITEENVKTMTEYNIEKCPLEIQTLLEKYTQYDSSGCHILLQKSFIQPIFESSTNYAKAPLSGIISYFEINDYEQKNLCEKLSKIMGTFAYCITSSNKSKLIKTTIDSSLLSHIPQANKLTIYSDFDMTMTQKKKFKLFFTSDNSFLKNYYSQRTSLKFVKVDLTSQEVEGTQIGNSNNVFLRHLLKYSDTLPVKPPKYMLEKNMTIKDILEELCVKRGPFATLQTRENNFNTIEIEYYNGLGEKLHELTVKRDKSLRKLTDLKNINNQIICVNDIFNNQQVSFTELTDYLHNPSYIASLNDKKEREELENQYGRAKIEQYNQIFNKFVSDEKIKELFFKTVVPKDCHKYIMPEFYIRAFARCDNLFKLVDYIQMISFNELKENPKMVDADSHAIQYMPFLHSDIKDAFYRTVFLNKYLKQNKLAYFIHHKVFTQHYMQILKIICYFIHIDDY